MSLSSIAVWYYGNYRALGWGMLAGSIMAIVDGQVAAELQYRSIDCAYANRVIRWVSKDVSGKGEWGHWGAIPIGLGLGTGLLAMVGV